MSYLSAATLTPKVRDIDPGELEPHEAYALLSGLVIPRPIAW